MARHLKAHDNSKIRCRSSRSKDMNHQDSSDRRINTQQEDIADVQEKKLTQAVFDVLFYHWLPSVFIRRGKGFDTLHYLFQTFENAHTTLQKRAKLRQASGNQSQW